MYSLTTTMHKSKNLLVAIPTRRLKYDSDHTIFSRLKTNFMKIK